MIETASDSDDLSRTPRRAVSPRLLLALLSLGLVTWPAAMVNGQHTNPDQAPEEPAGRGPREAPVLAPMGRPGANGRDADAHDPLRPAPGSLVREGAFIRNGRGRMVAGDGGAWVYIFDADARGKSEPPMILQPCIRLTEMRRLAEDKKETITFSISGQVFVYDGRNYLLPTHFTTVSAEDARSRELDAPEGAAPASTIREGAVQSDDPRAADLLREIQKEAEPGVGARPRIPSSAAGAAPTSLLREGLTVVQRRGRVERIGGSWVFLTDNGAQQRDETGADAPLRLSPCLILQEIERLVRERGERQAMSLSGQVFVYEDRNYLIPTVFQLEPDREGNLIPAQ